MVDIFRAFKGVWPKVADGVYVTDTARIIGDVDLGADVSIWYGSVLRGDVGSIRIGARTNIQDLSMLHMSTGISNTLIGEEVTVGHNVVIHGALIGDGALIGMGAILLDNCEIGAEAVITRENGDLAEQVLAATLGQPIDVVADLVAGPLFGTLINLLKPEGRYTTAGAIGGAVVTLDLRTIYLKHLQLHGSSQGTRSAFRRLVGHIEEGRVKPLLWQTYPLSRIREAQTAFMAKHFVGKLVMQPDRKWRAIGSPEC